MYYVVSLTVTRKGIITITAAKVLILLGFLEADLFDLLQLVMCAGAIVHAI